MGQKSSKKTDRYVTGDVTHCNLPDQDVTRYVGRAREYTAVDVIIKKTEDNEPASGEEAKQRSPVRHPPNSVLRLLTGAHRKSYLLAFVVPKVKGSKPSQLGRNSILFEEAEDLSEDNAKCGVMTHTVFLLRPKVKSRLKKEFSLKKMEAQKTFLNVMMDIEHHSVFSIKDINCDITPTSIGDCVNKLQEKIDEESAKCGRLLSVMRVEEDETTKNGTSENGVSEKPSHLTLRMIYLHETGDNLKPKYNYKVECVHIKCTEKKLKLKKKAKSTQSKRDTNVTWSEDWLTLVKEDSRLTEVISVGEIALKDASGKENKKPKLREFDVTTLCFYENIVPDEKGAAGDKNPSDDAADEVVGKPMKYDGMVREVWAPIDDNVQNNLEAEAEKYGGAGWELCTVLVTSQVRMKPDGSEFRKCAIFFQRPKEEFVSEIEKGKSKENLLMDGTTKIEVASGESEPQFLEVSPPTSPKEKVERFGIAMLPVIDIGQTKLRATKPSPKLEKSENEPNQLTSGIAAVQLKKVNRDALKKNSPDINRKEESEVNQVKLRRAEVGNSEKKEESKEVPWMKTLEKKREAVMKTNGSKLNENRPKSNEPDGELAKKLDEIKEKRAERMKRVSVHKEEEAKRKSLQETKDENPDNLNEVLNVSSVAVNIVANPDAESESKDDILPPPPSPINEVIPSPDIELPPPVDDNLISTGSTDVPEEDILPPPPSDVISPSSGDVVAPLNEDVIPPPAENLIVHDISNNENVNEPKSDNVILQSIDDVIPPPNDDAILPPSDDVISPPSDDVVSPPTVDVVLLPSVDAIPPPCDDVIPSLSCDDVIPPPPCDDMIPPPCDDMIPPPNDDIILPPNDDVIPPSPCDDMIPPPNDDIISPPNDDVIPPPKDDVISPPNDDVISPPNIDVIPPTIDDVILSTNDDTISPPNDDVILPPNDDVIPPPNDDVIPPPNDDVIPPPNDDVILPPNDDVIPPANDDVIPPANDDVIPPPNDDVISAPKDDVILPPNDDVISPPKDDVISTTNNDVILPPIDDVILSTNDDIIPPTISLGENASSADGKNSSKNRGDVSPLSVLNIPPPPPNNDDIEVDQNNQDNKEKLSSPENSVNIDDVLASFDFVYQDISGNSPNTFEGDHSNQQHASHTEDKESANSEINETVSSVDILDEITKQIDSDPAFSNGTPPNDGKEHLDLNSNHNNNVVNESKAQYTHNNT